MRPGHHVLSSGTFTMTMPAQEPKRQVVRWALVPPIESGHSVSQESCHNTGGRIGSELPDAGVSTFLVHGHATNAPTSPSDHLEVLLRDNNLVTSAALRSYSSFNHLGPGEANRQWRALEAFLSPVIANYQFKVPPCQQTTVALS